MPITPDDIFIPSTNYGDDVVSIDGFSNQIHNVKIDLKTRVEVMVKLLENCLTNQRMSYSYTIKQAKVLLKKCRGEPQLAYKLECAINELESKACFQLLFME